jgi:hypothetical protein
MTFRSARLSRLAVGTIAALLAIIPLSSFARTARGRTSTASGGAVGRPLPDFSLPLVPDREDVRRRLAEKAHGTYIGEMLLGRDSALARWPDRVGDPLVVWVQPASDIEGWRESFVDEVRHAFVEWNSVRLPVGFAFSNDSASADVHVRFVDHFDEEISGRTKWARDDHWWITDADIALAVYHRDGPMLDEEAMHAMTLHEVGHVLGLDHTADSTSIMAPKVRVRSLSRADRATVRLLYTLPPGGVR